MNEILTVTGLNKSFGALRVAKNVSFTLDRGEALGIIGPNGAGKSTLFNLVGGNLRADAGSLHLSGRDITKTSIVDRCRMGIGRSFQIPRPFGQMSVFENLLVAGAFGQKKSETDVIDRVSEILRLTGLEADANKATGGLPLLSRKRLELARALATGPDILLLDEIAGGLTEGECQDLIATIRRVQDWGVSIIWIEHVLHALTAVVTRILVLNFGEIIADGPPDVVMAQPDVREIYLGLEV